MTRRVRLHEIAHARAGDKGDTSNISLWVYEAGDYEAVRSQVTPALLRSCFGELFRGTIHRFELPHLHGLNFVLEQALEGGVNGSLNLDGHGKSWSYLLLGVEIDLP